MIGMDAHKRSVTIDVVVRDEQVVGGGRFATGVEGWSHWGQRCGPVALSAREPA
jgi:hypothetical protein